MFFNISTLSRSLVLNHGSQKMNTFRLAFILPQHVCFSYFEICFHLSCDWHKVGPNVYINYTLCGDATIIINTKGIISCVTKLFSMPIILEWTYLVCTPASRSLFVTLSGCRTSRRTYLRTIAVRAA